MTDTDRYIAASEGQHWAPGTQILWRYRENGRRGIHICRPVTVVRDDADVLALWLASGTVCVRPVLADGRLPYEEPLATRYTAPRTVRQAPWRGVGLLSLARPGQPWSVWLWWDESWRFKSWYVNLESPGTRWAGGVDSEDHFLDIDVYPDRTWKWRDEDEFAQAQQDGLMDADQARMVEAAGRDALASVEAWASPFSDGWENWRPDPAWPVPELPDDWDQIGTARRVPSA
ncbi:cytidylyl-2-hydroxypropylphosphonate hydrolase [Streptomyces sp. 8L]|uniref:cytidylyl-2-hydroxypropylphosphonate hydrolase n=1 Tax=Streptomyces sp. 8L TaxID=2877242 RepID=UPI001CD682A7|nr:DUF402 domain-containing protein [Streptomyces sp. 8L]MCA1219967.1 DUF402 domain-containing protein [Streptomyces sp. 8L]